MRHEKGNIHVSATDLANHLACKHLTKLEYEAAIGERKKPYETSHRTELLRKRGEEHERAYKEHLLAQDLSIVELTRNDSQADAVAAMHDGADVIVQARLGDDMWGGYSDFLIKEKGDSNLGDYHYEITDTKLANQTKGGTVLQLCLYSELLGEIQGKVPENMNVVSPGNGYEPERFRFDDYSSYYRLVKKRLQQEVERNVTTETYPYPCSHCDVCRWWRVCEEKREADDHLSLIAGVSRGQMMELESRGHRTLTEAARLTLPFGPERGSEQTYERVHHQARVQLQGREEDRPVHEVLDFEPGYGLTRLPEPSEGDVFFDIEGDRFVGNDGLEYLFGWITDDTKSEVYRRLWAFDEHEERRMFEEFMDRMMARWEEYPDMHIYHYNHYEPTQLKRLMGKYATQADELDMLLRGQRFVDLYPIVKQSMRASVESYSIKKLEPFYDYEREVGLEDEARENLKLIESALEFDTTDSISDEIRRAVAGYNRDDCASTRRLRDWLEQIRAKQIAAGRIIERPELKEGDPSAAVSDDLARIRVVADKLLNQVPEDSDLWTPEHKALWTLGQSMEFFKRESKVSYWEYFRMRELDAEQMLDESTAISSLQLLSTYQEEDLIIYRYTFPEQETKVKVNDTLRDDSDNEIGSVFFIDTVQRIVDIKPDGKFKPDTEYVFAFSHIRPGKIQEVLLEIGDWVADNGLMSTEPSYGVARNIMMRKPPHSLSNYEGSTLERACKMVEDLDGDVLIIQGPPGTGKTYTGAQMICRLLRQGKRVGISANSHKVIRNLQREAVKHGPANGVDVQCLHVEKKGTLQSEIGIRVVRGYGAASTALKKETANVFGGTAWMWARPEFEDKVDVLIVDEAGQLSLQRVLAMTKAAPALVLIGDPVQLEQPIRGAHPDGVDVSAMEYLLNGEDIIPDELGLFISETRRMHPQVCTFVSDLFYERKLKSHESTTVQDLIGHDKIVGPGIWHMPVRHEGNRNSSREEAEAIRAFVESLIDGSVSWTDSDGKTAPISLKDILFIAPYNSQVTLLKSELPGGAHVGTVDKFQGQQAAIVIYSLATSSPEDAPRGLSFLYSSNRLNVAISRAKVASVLVCCTSLFAPECKTPAQMRLANGLCRLREGSRLVTLE